MPTTLQTKQPVDRARCVLIAELGVEAERWQDVVTEIKKIVFAYNARLSIEERSLLSIAFKNITNTIRNSWRAVDAIEAQTASAVQATANSNVHANVKRKRELVLIRQQKERIENNLLEACNDIVDLLDRYLLLAATSGEEAVFYAKMKGDYYRYLAEFGPEKERKRFAEASLQAYKSAYKRALASLSALDPTRLGVALNFSVFYHDVYKSPSRACHLAKSAFDDAIQSLNPASTGTNPTLRDSLSILQLLRDDLLLWVEEM